MRKKENFEKYGKDRILWKERKKNLEKEREGPPSLERKPT